jgi:hypothetical protein
MLVYSGGEPRSAEYGGEGGIFLTLYNRATRLLFNEFQSGSCGFAIDTWIFKQRNSRKNGSRFWRLTVGLTQCGSVFGSLGRLWTSMILFSHPPKAAASTMLRAQIPSRLGTNGNVTDCRLVCCGMRRGAIAGSLR